MFDNVFEIDFAKLLRWMLPVRLRMVRLLAILSALSNELNTSYQHFKTNRQNNLYRLSITPQVCFLEKLLNDRYDFSSRRIYIAKNIKKPVTYIYRREELKPVYLGKKFIYRRNESGDNAYDFIVFVPLDVVFESAEMISLLDINVLPGITYKIQRF